MAASGSAFDFDEVEVADVSQRYGRRRALSHVTLSARAGEVVGLLGPNGAGKSTLLSILATLVRPTSGEVRYGRQSARDIGDALRGRVGVLGHDLFLYGDLTARENLAFFGALYGLRDLPPRIDAALAAARLSDRGGDLVRNFSRGLRQRLALERALLHAPRLVLLDEPFTGLDDTASALLQERLRGLREAGTIVFLATHDFESAESLFDRAICLHHGRGRDLPAGGGPLRERYRRALAEAES